MISKSFIKKLSNALPSSYRFAHEADHPLLMDGPDLMVGGDGRLTCVVSDKKLKSAERLLAQLSLLRLALPQNATIVLATNNDNFHASLSREYDSVFDPKELNASLVRLIQSKQAPRTNKKDIQNSKHKHQYIYSKLMLVGRSRANSFHDDRSAKRVVTADRAGSDTYKTFIINTRLTKNNIRRQITSTCYRSVAQYVVMDNGTPYISRDQYFKILLSDFLPSSRHDPEKPMRALAFSGNLITDVQTYEEAEEVVALVSDLLKKKQSRGHST